MEKPSRGRKGKMKIVPKCIHCPFLGDKWHKLRHLGEWIISHFPHVKDLDMAYLGHLLRMSIRWWLRYLPRCVPLQSIDISVKHAEIEVNPPWLYDRLMASFSYWLLKNISLTFWGCHSMTMHFCGISPSKTTSTSAENLSVSQEEEKSMMGSNPLGKRPSALPQSIA